MVTWHDLGFSLLTIISLAAMVVGLMMAIGSGTASSLLGKRGLWLMIALVGPILFVVAVAS